MIYNEVKGRNATIVETEFLINLINLNFKAVSPFYFLLSSQKSNFALKEKRSRFWSIYRD
jgi:hypothetical protein